MHEQSFTTQCGVIISICETHNRYSLPEEESTDLSILVEKPGPWILHVMSAEDVGDTYELKLRYMLEEE